MRAEVQHRTEPLEAALAYLKNGIETFKKSRSTVLYTLGVGLLSFLLLRMLFQPPSSESMPDLMKVAGLAKSFEPLIYYSENGAQQIDDLQDTGIAVWDLGESVRTTNMTSAPIIVRELDDHSENLKTLAIELTRVFVNVDGDVDRYEHVMI